MGFGWAIRDLFVEQMGYAELKSESVGAGIVVRRRSDEEDLGKLAGNGSGWR
jgi:hypothetical protein